MTSETPEKPTIEAIRAALRIVHACDFIKGTRTGSDCGCFDLVDDALDELSALREQVGRLQEALRVLQRIVERFQCSAYARNSGSSCLVHGHDPAERCLRCSLMMAPTILPSDWRAALGSQPTRPVIRHACMGDVDRLYPPGTVFEDCPICATLLGEMGDVGG